MKIYNKKKFYFSLLWLILGVSLVIFSLMNEDFDLNRIFVAACVGIMAINGLVRSFSQKMTRHDKIEELDERNRLIELKSKRKAFQIMQYTLLCTGLVFAVFGGIYKEMVIGTIGITGTAIWTFSLIIEWLTFSYYEFKH